MQESFLAYVWQFQYFDKHQLAATSGESLQVIVPGRRNTDSGADFAEASLLIDGVRWFGAVELHLRTSDWLRHAHEQDRAYDQVVLHVVWQHDLPPTDARIRRGDGTPIPVLALQGRVDPLLVEKFHLLQANPSDIACAPQWAQVRPVTALSMLDKSLIRRLERKAGEITGLLALNKGDWEETAYQALAKNFGFKVNSEAFLRLAQALPFKILRKYADNLLATEALLLGQAGWLEASFADQHLRALQVEHRFLAHKYELIPAQLKTHEWKLLRMRPANFPTVRLAQFAALIHQCKNLFAPFMASEDFAQLGQLLAVDQSDYWQHHYLPDQPSPTTVAGLGQSSIENIVINTIVPLLVAYSMQKDEPKYMERAMHFLEQLPAETNNITKKWRILGLPIRHASDSQAVIELFNQFCTPKRCLDCNIGASLVRPG